ncbi:MAG: hypothetical protein ACLQMO_05040 [Acidobacteriaceae bacterium]
MIVTDGYANLLSQTIRAMEDRLISMQRERDQLLEQLRDLEGQISFAQKDVETAKAIWGRSPFSAKPVGDTKPLSDLGMTEAITYVLRTLMQRMSPSEVRDKMAEWGFDFSSYKTDVISSIHTILKRLAKRGDAQEINEGHRKKSYKWVGNAGRTPGTIPASETKSPKRV